MKKLILGSAILAVLGMSANAMAAPNSGTVNFIGAVSTATCEISLKDNNGGNLAEVNLGSMSNTAASTTPVDFKLVPQDPTCLAKNAATVSWSSPSLNSLGLANAAVNGTNAYLAISATNAVQQNADAVLKQGQTTFTYQVTTGGLQSFNYRAALGKASNTATLTAGAFNASASYVVAYK